MNGYSFENLEVYKKSREFRKEIYKVTKKLPEKEKYNLIKQMQRASLSMTNCIAEGHGRYHFQENIQFLRQSRGSVEELIDDINVCLDEKYIEEEYLLKLKEQAYQALKKINGYIKYLRTRKETSELVKDHLTI